MGIAKEPRMTKTQDAAVRNYLTSLRDPSALRDDDGIADLQTKIEQTDDELERLQLRQQLLDLENPSTDGYEDAFVEHAKAWADKSGISADAFIAEGVPAAVLRRAGFRGVPGGRLRSTRSRRTTTKPASTRSRVSADEVRAAIPNDSFTVKDLQERSGASPAVVRRVISEEVDAGRLTDQGADPDHTGPGRAATVYQPA
jgi:tryptophanase